MKRGALALLIVFSLLLVGASSATTDIKSCQKDCSTDKRAESAACKEDANVCLTTCKEMYASCISEAAAGYMSCKASCTSNECLRSCTAEQRESRRACSLNECTANCYSERKTCTDLVNSVYKSCPQSCSQQNVPISCGNHSPGDLFFQGCDACACTYGGDIKCVSTPLCHFTDTWVPRSECAEAGGLYHQLCNGPYFDIVCSRANYCLCEGVDEFTCPAEFTCVTEFTLRPPRTQTTGGWKDMIGRELGDIGICARH